MFNFTNELLDNPFVFILFTFTFMVGMQKLIEWLEAHQLPCYYKKFLGIECLGCGMQTALLLLLKGEFLESFTTFPALLPIIGMVVYLILHLVFKFRKGAHVLKIWFIFTIAIMITSYLIKLFTI
jgi:hypothetical protein